MVLVSAMMVCPLVECGSYTITSDVGPSSVAHCPSRSGNSVARECNRDRISREMSVFYSQVGDRRRYMNHRAWSSNYKVTVISSALDLRNSPLPCLDLQFGHMPLFLDTCLYSCGPRTKPSCMSGLQVQVLIRPRRLR